MQFNNVSSLTDAQIRASVPAVFGDSPAQRLSTRYSLMPTSDVLNALREGGWEPVHARQTIPKADPVYARHLLRFRHRDTEVVEVGDGYPEIALVNSHDGSSAYQMHGGFYRLVCSNGMVVSDGIFARISIRHCGDIVSRVMQAAGEFVRGTPRIVASIARMRERMLTDRERFHFAERGLQLRFGETVPVNPSQVLIPKRTADESPDLWTTLNVVQENLLRGGLAGRSQSGRNIRTRSIRAISADLRLNKGLWAIAAEFQQAA